MSEKLVQDAAESEGVYMAVQRSKNRSKQSPRTLPIIVERLTVLHVLSKHVTFVTVYLVALVSVHFYNYVLPNWFVIASSKPIRMVFQCFFTAVCRICVVVWSQGKCNLCVT